MRKQMMDHDASEPDKHENDLQLLKQDPHDGGGETGEKKPVEEIQEHVQQEVQENKVPWYRSAERARALLIANTLVLALFAALAWWVHIHPVLAIDVTITKEFQERQDLWIKDTMFFVSSLGSIPMLLTGLALVTVIVFWLVRLRLEAVMLAASLIVCSTLSAVIKVIVSRPRPTASLVDVFQAAAGKSFPSGHVMSYVGFWGMLFSLGLILFNGKRWWNQLLLIIPAFFVVMVGPSRIYLGDHWASDVLGAYLISGVIVSVAIWIYLNLRYRGVLQTTRKTSNKQELVNSQ